MKYMVYDPGGNKTALVIGDKFKDKKVINDLILSLDSSIEQVGFLSTSSYCLSMTGGEFCGNATRCSASYYLYGKPGTIDIVVSGTNKVLKAGIDSLGKAFSQIPHTFRKYC